MCLLAYCKTRKLTRDEFESCFDWNGDGVGIAYKSRGSFHYIKGFMNLTTAWKFYKKFPNAPHVIHFRLGTSGDNIPELTHPFICSKDSNLSLKYSGKETLLFHNGIIHDWRAHCVIHEIDSNDKKMSDTRFAAILIGKKGIKVLNELNGKYIALHKGKIYTKGHFIKENGVYFSNDGYKMGRYDWLKDDYYYEKYYGKYDGYGGYKKESTEISNANADSNSSYSYGFDKYPSTRSESNYYHDNKGIVLDGKTKKERDVTISTTGKNGEKVERTYKWDEKTRKLVLRYSRTHFPSPYATTKKLTYKEHQSLKKRNRMRVLAH